MKVGAVVAAAVILMAPRAEASSFNRWLRTPYPVASRLLVSRRGRRGRWRTHPAGQRYEGWYVARRTWVTSTRLG